MSEPRSHRIKANCNTIWGIDTYDFYVESDEAERHYGVVKRNSTLLSPLTMTGICSSREQAWNELDRMLGLWASDTPMSSAQEDEMFGGSKGRGRKILQQFGTVLDKSDFCEDARRG